MSPLGLGLAAIGRPAYINLGRREDLPGERTLEQMRERAYQLLDEALQLGIRYFDAARSYGLAEQFLGAWVTRRDPLPVAITCGSKWGYRYVGDWRMRAAVHEVKDHSLPMLQTQYRESRQLLGRHLDLYQIHSATLDSGVLDDRAVMQELVHLAQGGLVVGLSVSGPQQSEVIRRALTVQVDGVNPFSEVQATWNLLEPSAGSALSEAHQAGWGVLVKEGLANGRLLVADDPRLAPLRTVAAAHGVGPDAIALASILAQDWADVVLCGAVTVDQLRSNATAAEVALSEDDLQALDELSETAGAYWRTRSELPWS